MSYRKIISKNPFTNKVIKEFPFIPNSELTQKIERSFEGYKINKKIPMKSRLEKLEKLASLIETNTEKYAKLVTTEMGKPISASIAEVKKCAAGCRFYAEHGANLAKVNRVKTDAKKSLVEFQALGSLYHLAPFNFPFWLGFKATIPAVVIGNTILHRNSDSTPLCGLAIEELFQAAGFDEYEFQNVFTSPEQTEYILSHPYVRGVSFTGSNSTGSIIGATAGKYVKKAALELGGSDPFIVLKDADIAFAVNLAMNSRLQNSGQVCFAGKRFIIEEQVYDQFKAKLLEKIATMKVGDPLKPETQMGPLARPDLVDNIHRQVQQSVDEGATLLYGGKRLEGEGYGAGNFYMPTVCEMPEGLDANNVLLKEETFGPVFALLKAKSEEEAIAMANNTEFGLGSVIVSRNTEKAEELGRKIESGSVFINELVRSDFRLPSGGMKNSGFGRELGEFGVHEFANIKTVWVGGN